MMDHRIVLVLNKLIEQHSVNLDLTEMEPEVLKELLGYLEWRSYSKGDIISDVGNTKAEFFFVLDGILSNYFIKDDGKEDYYTFIAGKRITGSWEVEFLNKPSEHIIRAETDANVVCVSLDDFRTFVDNNPKYMFFYNDIIPKALAHYLYEIQRRYNQKPEERYESLKEDMPEVVERIPSKIIASYLGIAPESFSRMKRRLEEKI